MSETSLSQFPTARVAIQVSGYLDSPRVSRYPDNVELAEAPIWASARKHGVSDEDIRYALGHIMNAAEDPYDEDVTLFLGPRRDGRLIKAGVLQLIEVGVLDTDDGPVIIHAMPARLGRFR
jgi:hypothetical protein